MQILVHRHNTADVLPRVINAVINAFVPLIQSHTNNAYVTMKICDIVCACRSQLKTHRWIVAKQ